MTTWPMSACGPLAQRDVGQHLGGAADDRRVRVDRGVAGEHADVLGAEDVAQGEELLADQRLDRRGVEGAPALRRARRSARRSATSALAGAGGRRQDHVGAGDELDQRLLLGRVEAQPLLGRPTPRTRRSSDVGVGRVGAGREGVEERHRPLIVAGSCRGPNRIVRVERTGFPCEPVRSARTTPTSRQSSAPWPPLPWSSPGSAWLPCRPWWASFCGGGDARGGRGRDRRRGRGRVDVPGPSSAPWRAVGVRVGGLGHRDGEAAGGQDGRGGECGELLSWVHLVQVGCGVTDLATCWSAPDRRRTPLDSDHRPPWAGTPAMSLGRTRGRARGGTSAVARGGSTAVGEGSCSATARWGFLGSGTRRRPTRDGVRRLALPSCSWARPGSGLRSRASRGPSSRPRHSAGSTSPMQVRRPLGARAELGVVLVHRHGGHPRRVRAAQRLAARP